jgi:hypothetical protein
MAQQVIKTSMGEFAISDHFTDAIGLNGFIDIEGQRCILSATIQRGRAGELRLRKLELLRASIDWNNLKNPKNPSRAEVYVLPRPPLRRKLIDAIMRGAESFVAECPAIFEEAGRRWLKDDVEYIEGKLDDAAEALANILEGLARMKAFMRSPDKSEVYSVRKWA